RRWSARRSATARSPRRPSWPRTAPRRAPTCPRLPTTGRTWPGSSPAARSRRPLPEASSQRGLLPAGVDSPAGLAARLAQQRYLADDGLATAAYLGLRLHRPLFCEGDAGVG